MNLLPKILALVAGGCVVSGCAGSKWAPVGNTLNHEIGLAGKFSQSTFSSLAEIKLTLQPQPTVGIAILPNRPLSVEGLKK